jgi:hypothetical protein
MYMMTKDGWQHITRFRIRGGWIGFDEKIAQDGELKHQDIADARAEIDRVRANKPTQEFDLPGWNANLNTAYNKLFEAQDRLRGTR